MSEEKKIVIVEDDNRVIKFQDVAIINDVIDREEVAEVERQIAELINQRNDIDSQIAELNDKLAYAKRIIAIADEQKALAVNEVEQVVEDSANNEIVGE